MSQEKKKGAPRKPDPNLTPVQQKPSAGLTNTAFGLAKLQDGKNVIVKIKYNPLSGEVGTPELNIVEGQMHLAEEQFREIVDENIELEFISKAE